MLPIFIVGAALTAVGFGISEGADGLSKQKKAEKIGKKAETRLRTYEAALEAARAETNARAIAFGERKLQIRSQSIRELVSLLQKIGNRSGQNTIRQLLGFDIYRDAIPNFTAQSVDALNVLSVTASAGTAIASLSGAAATNATLAWLGGGSLASGGLGMAGGTLVLGGIALAPALLIGGFMLSKQGENALTNAKKYRAEVEKEVARIYTNFNILSGINERMGELQSLMERLDARLKQALSALKAIASSFDARNNQHSELLRLAIQLAIPLSEIMQVPVLQDGELSINSQQIVEKYRELTI